MNVQEDIDSIQRRLAQAESDCNGWRMANLQEKYLEACSMVEALECQLQALLKQRGVAGDGVPTKPAIAPS